MSYNIECHCMLLVFFWGGGGFFGGGRAGGWMGGDGDKKIQLIVITGPFSTISISLAV